MDTRHDGPRQVWTKTGCLSTFPKPSQKGAVTPWLAGRGMQQAAFTYSLAPSHHTLRTGDLNPLMQNITIHSHTTICLYSLANMFFCFVFWPHEGVTSAPFYSDRSESNKWGPAHLEHAVSSHHILIRHELHLCFTQVGATSTLTADQWLTFHLLCSVRLGTCHLLN